MSTIISCITIMVSLHTCYGPYDRLHPCSSTNCVIPNRHHEISLPLSSSLHLQSFPTSHWKKFIKRVSIINKPLIPQRNVAQQHIYRIRQRHCASQHHHNYVRRYLLVSEKKKVRYQHCSVPEIPHQCHSLLNCLASTCIASENTAELPRRLCNKMSTRKILRYQYLQNRGLKRSKRNDND